MDGTIKARGCFAITWECPVCGAVRSQLVAGQTLIDGGALLVCAGCRRRMVLRLDLLEPNKTPAIIGVQQIREVLNGRVS